MFNPWTATEDEAIAATLECPETDDLLRNPRILWGVVQNINASRADIEAGDGFAVLGCISACLNFGLVAPMWLTRAFNERYMRVFRHEVGSWDDAFGRPYPPHTRLPDLRRRRELKFKVLLRVRKLHDEGSPIDEALFERVAAEFGIGRTLCTELYYDAKAIAG